MSACAHALCLPYGGCQFDSAVHTDAHGNVVDTCGHCTLHTFAGITARSIQSGCPVHSGRDSTVPRRVPTEVERTARHVHLGPLATVIARLGVALEESRREVQRLHADNDQLRQEIKGRYTPGGSGSSEAQQAIAHILAANEQHIVPRDPDRPPLHWRDITGLPEPRRRWWHRLTRRNP